MSKIIPSWSRRREVEDEIDNRSESVEAIVDGLSDERQTLEWDLTSEQLFHDVFSKKSEKMLKYITEIMTGPLFTLPMIAAS